MSAIKEEARKVIEDLPEDATWDDLMYKLYVRQKIEAGLRAADWFDYRRQHLDPRLTAEQKKNFWLGREALFEGLDRYLADGIPLSLLDHAIKRSQDDGETWDDLFEQLVTWLRERRTPRSLDLVAHALVCAGRRTDLALLGEIEIDGNPAEVRQILDRTAFNSTGNGFAERDLLL